MRRVRHCLALVAALALAAPAAAQVVDPIPYALFDRSDFGYGCDGPCACPFFFAGSLKGTFTFVRTGVDPLFTHYELRNIFWRYPVPGTARVAVLTGHGTYDLGGEVARTQRMQLDLTTDGVLEQHFDSGVVPASVSFPAIDIDVRVHVNVCIDSVLHVIAGPQGTESVPPGGAPLRLAVGPNPARTGTDVVLELPEAESGDVTVLNVAGQGVAVLARGELAAGENRWRWDGRTTSGSDAGAGVFWVRARVGARSAVQRFVRFP